MSKKPLLDAPPSDGPPFDAVDEIVNDVRQQYPDLDVMGLPITGRVLRLAQHLQTRRDDQLARFGLTVADFDVLASLRRRAGAGAVNVRDLQRTMMLSSSGITKRLDRLEHAALVARGPDPGDRRGVLIRLTDEGRKLIDEAIPAITRFETDLVRGAVASERDRSRLERSLRQLLVAHELA